MADITEALAGNKMLQLRQDMAALRQEIASCEDEEIKKKLRRELMNKETHYNILADRQRMGF